MRQGRLFCVVVAGVEGFSQCAPSGLRRDVVVNADDSWSAELRAASVEYQQEETKSWLKKQSPDAVAREKNDALLSWLQAEGVWISELSGWGQPPHS